MTYKELLFKMADKGMLTLSADKDGRGLFWAGMDNMEALEQPFNWGDFQHQYSKSDVDAMRETLHESEWEGLKDKDLKEILREGCVGWQNRSDRDVIDIYEELYYPDGKSDFSGLTEAESLENIYGESDNYEEQLKDKQGRIIKKFKSVHLKGKNLVICDKKAKEQQGEIVAKFNDIK